MGKIFVWIKTNWLVSLMGVVIAYLLLKNYLGISTSTFQYGSNVGMMDSSYSGSGIAMTKNLSSVSREMMPTSEAAPFAATNRMVVQDTNMSMLVKDVSEVLKGIENTVVTAGGYMVNRNVSKPEGAASGYISVRVPTEKRETALDEIRKLGVKVVSENVNGTDVTDQYVDLDERLASLMDTKKRIESIRDQAVRVQDLMDVQMQLTNIQQQIDSYKGQQKYLEQTAKLTMISVNLSTDELALPYAPEQSWRPEVVFKTAVRSLVSTLRGFGSFAIWLAVYSPVWGLAILGVYVVKKVYSKKS